MVHAIEAFTSARLKNPCGTRSLAKRCALLSGNLLTACNHPDDLDARSAMLLGAHLAGLAFSNAPVAGVHALAYPLGGLHHLPHGISNALMLRHVLAHNAEAAREHYAELAGIIAPDCAGDGSQARAAVLIERLDQMVTASGIAPRLRDHGITEQDIPMLAREAMKQERLLINKPLSDWGRRRAPALRGGMVSGGRPLPSANFPSGAGSPRAGRQRRLRPRQQPVYTNGSTAR